MGWASGCYVMNRIIENLQAEIDSEIYRKRLYKLIIPALQDADWDTELDCIGRDPAYDHAIRELHPDWFEEFTDGQ